MRFKINLLKYGALFMQKSNPQHVSLISDEFPTISQLIPKLPTVFELPGPNSYLIFQFNSQPPTHVRSQVATPKYQLMFHPMSHLMSHLTHIHRASLLTNRRPCYGDLIGQCMKRIIYYKFIIRNTKRHLMDVREMRHEIELGVGTLVGT